MTTPQIIQSVFFLVKAVSELTSGVNQRLRDAAADAIREGRSLTEEELNLMEQDVREAIAQGRADNDGQNA